MKKFALLSMPFTSPFTSLRCALASVALLSTSSALHAPVAALAYPKPHPQQTQGSAFTADGATTGPPSSSTPALKPPPDALPRNWLAFVYGFGLGFGSYQPPRDVTDNQSLLILLRDGTVIWNDTVQDADRYYPEIKQETKPKTSPLPPPSAADVDTDDDIQKQAHEFAREQARTRINPDAWRQGKADPEKLRAFLLLVNSRPFFTENDKPKDYFSSIFDVDTQRVGVTLARRRRILDKNGLASLGEGGGDLTRHLYEIYMALSAIRPTVSQRYVPHTIRVGAWEIEDDDMGKATPIDWPESTMAGAPNPAQISQRSQEESDWKMGGRDNTPDPPVYTYLSGSKARAIMKIAAQSGTLRYKKKLYRLRWSPALRVPDGEQIPD